MLEDLVYTSYGIQEIFKKPGLVKEALCKLESLTHDINTISPCFFGGLKSYDFLDIGIIITYKKAA